MSEREHQTGDAEVATCHVCGVRFERQQDLLTHLDEAHRDDLLE